MNERQQLLLAELTRRRGQERLNWLVAQARQREPLPAELRSAAHRVEGCLARLWFVAEHRAGRCWFRCDSDSTIVKAVAGCICEFFTGLTPAEILAGDLAPLHQAGLDRLLTANRRDALSHLSARIRRFAAACLVEAASTPGATQSSAEARWFDAHNHLQDDRFAGRQGELVAACRQAGVARMVVNGACEADWPAVAALARQFPDLVIPSFGCHPWFIDERTPRWRETLARFLDETPGAVVGEIGLDRWKPGLDYTGQEEVFSAQLELAAERNLPASLHCLQAWGRLHELLRAGPCPRRGVLLHSYGGPAELVAPLAGLGAFFGFPGYFLHKRKLRQRDVFRQVPPDRLLLETDAPDQLLPDAANGFPLAAANGAPLNHPANLGGVYHGLAAFLGEPVPALAARVEANFTRLFGPFLRPA